MAQRREIKPLNLPPLDRTPDLVLKCEGQIWHMRSKYLYTRSAWFRKIKDEYPELIEHDVLTIEGQSSPRINWAIQYMNTGDADVEDVPGFGHGFFGPYQKGFAVAVFLGMDDLRDTVVAALGEKLARVAVILQIEPRRELVDEGLMRTVGLDSVEFFAEYALALRHDYARSNCGRLIGDSIGTGTDTNNDNGDITNDNAKAVVVAGAAAGAIAAIGERREIVTYDDVMRETLVEFGARTWHQGQEDAHFRTFVDTLLSDFQWDAGSRSERINIPSRLIVTNAKCSLCPKYLFVDGMRHIARAEVGGPGQRWHVFQCSECYDRMWSGSADEADSKQLQRLLDERGV